MAISCQTLVMYYMNSEMKIIKLYKVIHSNEAILFDQDFIRKVLITYDNYVSSTWLNEHVSHIEINYSDKTWRTINCFFHYLSQHNKEIVYLSATSKNESSSLIYANELLNQISPECCGLIELIIKTNNHNMENLYSLLKNICDFYHFDYGYCFNLKKNQDLYSEVVDKKSFITSLFSVTCRVSSAQIEATKRRRNFLIQVKQGIIPQIYEINIWNNKQLEQAIKEKLFIKKKIKLNGNLSIVETSDMTNKQQTD